MVPFMRITVIGASDSGKTALINTWVNGNCPLRYTRTEKAMLYYKRMELEDEGEFCSTRQPIFVEVEDSPGSERGPDGDGAAAPPDDDTGPPRIRKGSRVTVRDKAQEVKNCFAAEEWRRKLEYKPLMDTMLGQEFTVKLVARDGSVGLPSPDGSEGGIWNFPPKAVKLKVSPEVGLTLTRLRGGPWRCSMERPHRRLRVRAPPAAAHGREPPEGLDPHKHQGFPSAGWHEAVLRRSRPDGRCQEPAWTGLLRGARRSPPAGARHNRQGCRRARGHAVHRLVRADAPTQEDDFSYHALSEHWVRVVATVAEALASGHACLVHCRDGLGDTGVALACFLVQHGRDGPNDIGEFGYGYNAHKGYRPRMAAEDAVAAVRASRRGSLPLVAHEAAVAAFAEGAWTRFVDTVHSELMMSKAEARVPVPAEGGDAYVIKQSRGADSLFHALAAGLRPGGGAGGGGPEDGPPSPRGPAAAAADRARAADLDLREEASAQFAAAGAREAMEVLGTSLIEWVTWLGGSGTAAEDYARSLASGEAWGSVLDAVVCAQAVGCDLHVYEWSEHGVNYELAGVFEVAGAGALPSPPLPQSPLTVSLLYDGGGHYDILCLG